MNDLLLESIAVTGFSHDRNLTRIEESGNKNGYVTIFVLCSREIFCNVFCGTRFKLLEVNNFILPVLPGSLHLSHESLGMSLVSVLATTNFS